MRWWPRAVPGCSGCWPAHRPVSRAPSGPQQWLAAAHAALELYGDHPAIAWQDLAAEVATEVRLLRATQAELAAHASQREACYQRVDPAALARSLPGLATVGGPALVATMGTASRFATAGTFRSFTGLAPKASETGQTDRKGQPITKAGNRLLRTTLVRAADHARRQDPQLARIYWTQMVQRGKDHLGAVCVVAAHLAEAGLDGHGPRHALRHLRHRRHPRHPRPGQGHHRRALDRARASPPAAAQQEGEGPSASPHRTCAWRSKAQRGDPPPRRPLLAASPAASS